MYYRDFQIYILQPNSRLEIEGLSPNVILSRFAKMKLVSWHSAVLHIWHIARGIELIKETWAKEEKFKKKTGAKEEKLRA